MSTHELIAVIVERQNEARESDQIVAERLHISRQAWNLLRRGKCQPSVRMLREIRRAYPELAGKIADFVLS